MKNTKIDRKLKELKHEKKINSTKGLVKFKLTENGYLTKKVDGIRCHANWDELIGLTIVDVVCRSYYDGISTTIKAVRKE